MRRQWLASLLCLSSSTAVVADSDLHRSVAADYQLRMSIEATVSGRRFLFFSFKGMLLAEATLNLTSSPNPAAADTFSLRDVAERNFMLMSVNRKASEFQARCVAPSIEKALGLGHQVIAHWADEYTTWAGDVKPDRRKVLPFLLDSDGGDPRFDFLYTAGTITGSESSLRTRYGWPSDSQLDLPIFDGLGTALSLFNHSPFPSAAESATFERAFHVAPQLRDICLAILPQAKSAMEFSELTPVVVGYELQQPPTPGLQRSTGTATPHRQIEKSFWLESYDREAVRTSKTHRLQSDRIRIHLAGTPGNDVQFEIVLARSK